MTSNKLNINKPYPADLSSLSVFPNHSYDRSVPRPNTVPRYGSSQKRPTDLTNSTQPQQLQSHLYSSSQSQQSLSQGVAFSQPFSQNTQPFSQLSQDDPSTAFEEWMRNRSEAGASRPYSRLPPAQSSQGRREDSTKFALSKASNLLERLHNSSETKNQISDEVERRLEALDEGLSKVIRVLDSVQGDLQDLSRAVQNASIESESVKQKLITQENSLNLLLKEEARIKTILSTSLKQLSEKKADDKAVLRNLSNELETIPTTLTKHLSMLKTEIFAFVRNELQTVRECIKSQTQEGCSIADQTFPYGATEGTSKKCRPSSKKNALGKPESKRPSGRPRKSACGKIKEQPAFYSTRKEKAIASLVTRSRKEIRVATPVFRNSAHRPTQNGNDQVTAKERGWIQMKPMQTKTMWHDEKVYDFEEENGDNSHLLYSSGYVCPKTESVFDEPLDEEETRKIREKMLKARLKRCRSGAEF